jgi:hypothetical protein
VTVGDKAEHLPEELAVAMVVVLDLLRDAALTIECATHAEAWGITSANVRHHEHPRVVSSCSLRASIGSQFKLALKASSQCNLALVVD